METILESCFFGSLLFPPIVFIYVVWRLRGLSAARRALVAGLFSCAAFAALMILTVTIFARTVGPDAYIGRGIEILANLGDGLVLAVFVGGILAAFGIILVTYREKNARRSRLKGLISLGVIMGGTWIIYQVSTESVYRSELRPNVFSPTVPKWMFDSGWRIDHDAPEASVVSNWISANQSGWEFGSDDDFDPQKTQFSCDNYTIQVDAQKIVMQYYKSEADFTNDPSDSYIIIKRQLAAGEQAFWATQVNQVEAAEKWGVKVP